MSNLRPQHKRVPPGSKPTVPARSRNYDQATIDAALLTVAACGGNAKRASRMLAARDIKVPARTLQDWHSRLYREHYLELVGRHGREIEDVAVAMMRETILHASEVERRGLEKAYEQLEAGEAKDPSATARNAAVVKGINTQHLLTLTDRPTIVVEHRNPDWYIQRLQALGVGAVVDSTAEEVDPEERGDDRSTARDPEVA